jgi:hypothetical protein
LKEKGFREEDPTLIDLNEEIEHIEKRIHNLLHEIPKDPHYFAGIAFVSFQTEQEKREVLDTNTHTSMERFKCFMNNGRLKDFKEEDLTWDGNKLFLDEAPEPNDIDWEFVHSSTTDKIYARIKSNLLTLLFVLVCFLAIKAISDYQDEMNDKSFTLAVLGKVNKFALFKSSVL